MDRLRQIFEDLGFSSVQSYIQSGNIFFESPDSDQQALARKIEAKLLLELNFEVATVVRTVDQVKSALSRDPFKGVPVDENTRLCVVFVTQPLPDNWPVISPKGDIELLGATDGEVFAVLHQIPGRAANPAAFIEKTFPGVKATSRFHHTLVKMIETMEKLR
jgi:uncharacterized protein (DUF1697 family)